MRILHHQPCRSSAANRRRKKNITLRLTLCPIRSSARPPFLLSKILRAGAQKDSLRAETRAFLPLFVRRCDGDILRVACQIRLGRFGRRQSHHRANILQNRLCWTGLRLRQSCWRRRWFWRSNRFLWASRGLGETGVVDVACLYRARRRMGSRGLQGRWFCVSIVGHRHVSTRWAPCTPCSKTSILYPSVPGRRTYSTLPPHPRSSPASPSPSSPRSRPRPGSYRPSPSRHRPRHRPRRRPGSSRSGT